MQLKFDIGGMSCSACSSGIQNHVGRLKGVEKASVNLLTNTMVVTTDPELIKAEEIINAVESLGYSAALSNHSKKGKNENLSTAPKGSLENSPSILRLIISFAFLFILMYVSMGSMLGLPMPLFFCGINNSVSLAFLQFLLCLVVVYANRDYFTKGFKALWHLNPNMFSLIAVSASASVLYGIFAVFVMSRALGLSDFETIKIYRNDIYFDSAAMILSLIALGKYLEAKSKEKTKSAIQSLLNLKPQTANVLKDGSEIPIPLEDLVVGDIALVRPGERIPADGTVIEGSSAVDESLITGESIPVSKTVQSKVVAASFNSNGFIKIRVDKVGEDTTLAQIVKLVEEASLNKAPIAQLADKIALVFVPSVMAVAFLSFCIWLYLGSTFEFAFGIGITVLVISCPCALGLATPTAIMAGTGKGAEYGILLKSGEALQRLGNITTVVLDKTGTVTLGKPQITDIIPTNENTQKELLQIAASLESQSEHPLATAIVKEAERQNIALINTKHFSAVPGLGIKGDINHITYYAGSREYLERSFITFDNRIIQQAENLAKKGKTPLFFASNTILGIIALADTVKPTSAQAIEELKDMGLEPIMLTGDNKLTAQSTALALGIEKVEAEIRPEEKSAYIKKLQSEGKITAMVGDGINDSPALSQADVGIAIGTGSDIAIESADIVLMHSDLRDVSSAIKLSRGVVTNIKQNLFWAFFYNLLGIPLACGAFYSLLGLRLSPMIAAAAMTVSSLCVVTNALRLRNFKLKHKNKDNKDNKDKKEEKDNMENDICEFKKNSKDGSDNSSTVNTSNTSLESYWANNNKEINMVTIEIDGMMCSHCTGRVEKALQNFGDVKVSLEDKKAYIEADNPDLDAMKKAVEDQGYTVLSITK